VQFRRLFGWRVFFGCVAMVLGLEAPASGQFLQPETNGARLGEAATQCWRAGVIITARRGPCRGIVATAPIPVDWPEQQTKVIGEDFSPLAKVSYRTVEGGVKQMVVQVPFLPAGAECRALVTVEVTRHAQLPPENTDAFVLPDKRKMPREIRFYLGPSPEIESRSARVKSAARELDVDQEHPWKGIESIYDWVRQKVAYKEGHEGGALAALEKGEGDHEDLTSLFIAMCRATGVPARTVWVQGSCYPEFCLEDEKGKGYWFPCRMAGNRAFGEMPDHRPILEKGDNFRSPHDRRDRKRYLPETLDGQGGAPSYKFVRELVAGK
jgi:hypothetical protein